MKSFKENTLFLIDGSSFLYRAYYALAPLHTQTGQAVQAVYGFCRMTKKLIDMFDPRYMAVVWDSKGATKRKEIFKEYKATRQAPPSDLFIQKDYIIEFADMIGLKQFSKTGEEADDIMYSLAQWWAKKERDVVLITSDKDMGQALDKNIVMYDSFKNVVIDAKAFEEKMGFGPEKTTFYFALLGDSSDNIPGVKGIGAKGALELVSQYNSLHDAYKDLENIKSTRLKNALEQGKEDAFLSEKLFTLHHVTDLDHKEKDLVYDKSDWYKARPLFEQLDFKSLLEKMPVPEVQQKLFAAYKTSKERGYSFVCVTEQAQLDEVVAKVKEKKICAYDTETNGLSVLQASLVGISICCEEKISYYIPCGHQGDEKQLPLEDVIKTLKPIFEQASIKKIAHHAKFDQLVLNCHGIEVKGLEFDTMIAASLVKEDWQKATLKELSRVYLSEPMLTFKEVVEDKKLKDFSHVSLKEAVEYAAADAHQTFKLYPLLDKLLKEKNMDNLFYKVEMPIIQVLADMEKKGVYCDVDMLKELGKKVDHQLEQIYQTIIGLIPQSYASINLNSPRQVEELLFKSLKLTPGKKSAKGSSYSTDNEVLIELSKEHPIPAYIVQYRELYKLKTTYIEALPTFVSPKDGRIHTTYSQSRVATGRLSSSDPNLQNIPADGIGYAVRDAFKGQHGKQVFISADYSQIELRILAHETKDPVLLDAFKHGRDIHAQTAAGIFGIPLEKVDAHQRSVGKRINFSILYGLTPYGLSKDIGISVKEAKEFIQNFFDHYKKVRPWMDKVIEDGKKNGYVTTWLGRRRAVPGLREHNKHLYDLGCRIAVNTVPQGTSSEVMKLAMLHVDELLKKKYPTASLLLQIHDQIIIECDHDESKIIEKEVKKVLDSVVKWDVPLEVAIGIGRSWKDAEQ